MGSIKSCISYGGIRLRRAAPAAMAICLFDVFLLFLLFTLTSPALAGTETGEFCPTCPDWTDLDGWLAKKAAYENGLQKQQNGESAGSTTGSAASEKGYANPGLLTYPSQINGTGNGFGGAAVLDVRAPEEYQAGHIPGSVNLYWRELQSDGHLDPELAREALGRAGLQGQERILICGGGDNGEGAENEGAEGAAFVFWALSYFGERDLSILDGGIRAAEDAGIVLGTNAAHPAPVNFTTETEPFLLVTADELDGLMENDDVLLLDARDFSDYGQSRLGNGSICLSIDKLYQNSRIRTAGALKDLFERRLESTSIVLVYGTPQAFALFYSLRLMGYNATLLEGDWWKDTRWAVSNVNNVR